jgi:hypothetical protein
VIADTVDVNDTEPFEDPVPFNDAVFEDPVPFNDTDPLVEDGAFADTPVFYLSA